MRNRSVTALFLPEREQRSQYLSACFVRHFWFSALLPDSNCSTAEAIEQDDGNGKVVCQCATWVGNNF
jgi:hypothetical protein